MVELLLKYGADPTVADRLSRTPLHSAVSSGNYEIVYLLLQKDVVIDEACSPSRKALYEGANLKNLSIINATRKLDSEFGSNFYLYEELDVVSSRNPSGIEIKSCSIF